PGEEGSAERLILLRTYGRKIGLESQKLEIVSETRVRAKGGVYFHGLKVRRLRQNRIQPTAAYGQILDKQPSKIVLFSDVSGGNSRLFLLLSLNQLLDNESAA
ncbi:MAG TPA: hypothetical protein VK468_02740, partial [Pyrinomonadaceae bacterium]|nr:hypothetical protein [Pyrinomonadaceae bacterium]